MLGHIWPLFLEANAAPDPRTPHSPDGFPRARARGRDVPRPGAESVTHMYTVTSFPSISKHLGKRQGSDSKTGDIRTHADTAGFRKAQNIYSCNDLKMRVFNICPQISTCSSLLKMLLLPCLHQKQIPSLPPPQPLGQIWAHVDHLVGPGQRGTRPPRPERSIAPACLEKKSARLYLRIPLRGCS